jgi:hypothetical protein
MSNDATGFRLYDLSILKIPRSHLEYEIDFKKFWSSQNDFENFGNPNSISKLISNYRSAGH